MEKSFWHERWNANQIGFHAKKINPLLVTYFKETSIRKSGRVFVPLCGKTLDIEWLLSSGYRVAGVELSELAIEQLFADLSLKPEVTEIGNIKLYTAMDIDIFVGDIFELTGKMLGSIDAVFDRAALVALPENMRGRYAKQVIAISGKAPQLLLSFEYDQDLMPGPPFFVHEKQIRRHYEDDYDVSSLISVDVIGGLKGICPAKEVVWLLNPLMTDGNSGKNTLLHIP